MLQRLSCTIIIMVFTLLHFGARTMHALPCIPCTKSTPYKAVITVPILDMDDAYPPSPNPPASPETGQGRRVHQGLFNEVVTVLEERGQYVKVQCDDMIYKLEGENSLWTFRYGIRPLFTITSPKALATVPDMRYAARPTIFLTYPWHHFSLGTRFTHVPEKDTTDSYGVSWIDHRLGRVRYGRVPHSHAAQEIHRDAAAQRKLFVSRIGSLIDRVARTGPGMVIPYVWGGSSFLVPFKRDSFYLDHDVWQRTNPGYPYAGYDCSELIMRMAKMAGITFPWRMSVVMHHYLTPLSPNGTLEEGDIIWTDGHVMIVGNLHTNEVFESRGYGGGYGEVHRIHIKDLFDETPTFDVLRERYVHNKTVTYKKKSGALNGSPYLVALLKLIP